ncbi:hypothetical protein KNP414_04489 [Paenibacillus mucilaginosus KNP414]|uniref:Uncharacterized protein n=1 Tax=Paenibacillus mucilaginosus (strain KNP414) TaxID=1036673 RepID=F8F991_PAEMK|nr:hypothetical protein KNP414_04489 [Paenibacillus mucilaginosus KNP414]
MTVSGSRMKEDADARKGRSEPGAANETIRKWSVSNGD